MLLSHQGLHPENSLTARSICRGFSACHTNAVYVFCSADNCGLSCVFEKFHSTKWQMYSIGLSPGTWRLSTQLHRVQQEDVSIWTSTQFWANTDCLFLERGNISPNCMFRSPLRVRWRPWEREVPLVKSPTIFSLFSASWYPFLSSHFLV